MHQLKAEMEKLELGRARYYELSRLTYDLQKKLDEKEKILTLRRLSQQTSFEECQYPSMGEVGYEGVAYFLTEQVANDLIKALRTDSSYYYAYVLEWNGAGKYRVLPEFRIDHDREIVYTARFVKA